MAALPPLPKIEGDIDIVLDIYLHSLQPSSWQNEEYGDTDRLAELGSKVLDLIVTYHLFSKKPMLPAAKIPVRSFGSSWDMIQDWRNTQEERDSALSNERLNNWLEAYNLKQKLRIASTGSEATVAPQEIRRFFNAYVGALYIRNGLAVIQSWISKLIDPHSEVAYPEQSPPGYDFPAPPSALPPPLPNAVPVVPAVPAAPSANESMVTLALVNQTAMQKGYNVTYQAEQSGLAHMPIWTVKCLMNGQERGIGQGKSQKVAKEEAARMAWSRMGW